jgi:hypothetical protein
MAIKLDKVVPFGLCLDEYLRMFKLSATDLSKAIIGFGDGPASFNAEMQANGGKVVSIDPLYPFGPEENQGRFFQVVGFIMMQIRQIPGDWEWTYHR